MMLLGELRMVAPGAWLILMTPSLHLQGLHFQMPPTTDWKQIADHGQVFVLSLSPE